MDELLEELIVELKVPKRRRGKNIGNTSVPQKRQASGKQAYSGQATELG